MLTVENYCGCGSGTVRKPEERERPPFDAVTRRMLKTVCEDTSVCVCMRAREVVGE
jgi:hypothetical protein